MPNPLELKDFTVDRLLEALLQLRDRKVNLEYVRIKCHPGSLRGLCKRGGIDSLVWPRFFGIPVETDEKVFLTDFVLTTLTGDDLPEVSL